MILTNKNFSFNFYQKGKLIIESKSLVEKMRCFISKNSFVKLIFKDNYLSNSYQYMWNNSFGSVKID